MWGVGWYKVPLFCRTSQTFYYTTWCHIPGNSNHDETFSLSNQFFSDCLIFEDGPHTLFWNVSNKVPIFDVQHPRTATTSNAMWQSCSHYHSVHLSRTTGDNTALYKNSQHISIDNYIHRKSAKSQYWNNALTNCSQWNTLMQHITLHSVLQVFRIQHTNNIPSSKVYGTAPWFRQTVAVSHHKSLGLIPDQCMWDLQWTKWHWNRFFSIYFSFPSNHGVLESLQVDSGRVP